MKKLICLAALAGAVLLAGCGRGAPVPPKNAAVPTFVVGMGCSDASCTDVSHHHDCPADCADYSHHHNCPLDCADASHHHADAHHDFAPQVASSAVSAPALAVPTFVAGMGCADASCTDVSHHHDCPADCADYSHHHNCPLDCSDASHHHGGQSGTGAHHSEPGHHGGHH